MFRVPASKMREKFADILNEVAFRNARVVLHRHGKDLAAMISIEDLQRLQMLEHRYRSELEGSTSPVSTNAASQGDGDGSESGAPWR